MRQIRYFVNFIISEIFEMLFCILFTGLVVRSAGIPR